MTTGEKQQLFFRLFIQWSTYALGRGYQFTWGEAFRSDEQAEINAIGEVGRWRVAQLVKTLFPLLAMKILNNGKAGGIRNSAHSQRLGLDLNLFKDGVYQTTTEAWRELGEYWESLHPDCRWGGRFNDGNHLSMEHNGVK